VGSNIPDINDIEINKLVTNSKKVGIGDMFVCIKGARHDGHDYVGEVCEKGAVAVVVQDDAALGDGIVDKYGDRVAFIRAGDTRMALAKLSAAYFDYPAEKLTTIGITGTKGKTTTAYIIRSILQSSGLKTGLIGTVEAIIGEEVIRGDNTTPESYLIHEYFGRMVESGCKCVVMEVSSQGLMLHRTAGITFDYGVFTNLGVDHVAPNEHKDFDDYRNCKARLFNQCRTGIFNADDAYAKYMMEGRTCDIKTFGIINKADTMANNVVLTNESGVMGVEYDVMADGAFIFMESSTWREGSTYITPWPPSPCAGSLAFRPTGSGTRCWASGSGGG